MAAVGGLGGGHPGGDLGFFAADSPVQPVFVVEGGGVPDERWQAAGEDDGVPPLCQACLRHHPVYRVCE